MEDLLALDAIRDIAKKHSKKAFYDSFSGAWVFIKEDGKGFAISIDYPFLPKDQQCEILNVFKK